MREIICYHILRLHTPLVHLLLSSRHILLGALTRRTMHWQLMRYTHHLQTLIKIVDFRHPMTFQIMFMVRIMYMHISKMVLIIVA